MGCGGNGKMSFLKSWKILEYFSHLYHSQRINPRGDRKTRKSDDFVPKASGFVKTMETLFKNNLLTDLKPWLRKVTPKYKTELRKDKTKS